MKSSGAGASPTSHIPPPKEEEREEREFGRRHGHVPPPKRTPKLSREETVALSRELRLQMNSEVLNPKRQQELAWEIVQLNKGLAFRFLKRRCRQINVDLMDEDDIEQESRLLLLQAVNLWDPERGSLSAILNYVVLNALRDVPGRVGIRVPSNLRSGIRSAERVLWQEQAKGN